MPFPAHPAALLTRGLGTAGLSQTYKRVLFDNDETLALCKELENKTIKYWTACTEKMSTPTEEDGPKVENVEQYAGDPMPHLLIYLKGDLKATINVRFAGSVVSAWRCVLARAPRPLRPAPRPRPRVTLTKHPRTFPFARAGRQRTEADQDDDRAAGGVQTGRLSARRSHRSRDHRQAGFKCLCSVCERSVGCKRARLRHNSKQMLETKAGGGPALAPHRRPAASNHPHPANSYRSCLL